MGTQDYLTLKPVSVPFAQTPPWGSFLGRRRNVTQKLETHQWLRVT